MKRYCSLLVVVAAFAVGCTAVDDTLGQDFIPKNQQMELRVGELAPFESFVALNDSVPASGQGVVFLGSREDVTFGGMKAAFMTDFYPVSTDWNDGEFWGSEPVIDSVYLQFALTDIVGRSSAEQTFRIYEMRDSLKRDSIYKFNTPIADKAALDKPLFSFKMLDAIPANAEVLLKLTHEAGADVFLQRLVDVPQAVYENPWPDFHKMFYGLYFAATSDSPSDAAIYKMSLRSGSAGLVVFFHNNDSEEPEQKFATYDFRDDYWYSDDRVVNLHVNDVKYEWPSAVEDKMVDVTSGDLGQAQGTVYVQSLGGVLSYLKASDDLLAWFDNARQGYSNMVINQARLEVPLDGGAVQPTGLMPQRMGMYYFCANAVSVPDYNYTAENNGTTIPYGGYLFPSLGRYRMDVTQWVTQLMLDREGTTKEIWLAPELYSRASSYSQVALDGGNIKLIITYTLIR